MSIYTNPPRSAYVTSFTKRFTMPTDSGGIPAVAVSTRSASLIVSAYTILILLIFMVGWKLILAVIMAYWPTLRDKNRHIALVELWNSGESMNAAVLMFEFCKRMILLRPAQDAEDNAEKGVQNTSPGNSPRPNGDTLDPDNPPKPDNQDTISSSEGQLGEGGQITRGRTEPAPNIRRSNLWWGILFFFIAASMSLGNIAAGILIAGELLMGSVAPPAKDSIFYPDFKQYSVKDDNGAGPAKLISLRAPAAFRAIGAIESSEVTVRRKVTLEPMQVPEGQKEQWKGRNYSYNVTGVDMGLQSDPKLVLRVQGSCHTEYSWLVNTTGEGDTYRLWDRTETIFVKRQPVQDGPPTADFVLGDIPDNSSNISYAMIIKTAGRYSFTSGQDPWYATEKNQVNVSIGYQIRSGRPALSCWESKKWHLGSHEAEADQLGSLPGLKLYKLWADDVFVYEFLMPRVVTLGSAAGFSALKSAALTSAPSYILDANGSGMEGDLERLVLASWVSSSNVLRETTAYKGDGLVNLLRRGKGVVEDQAAEFVLQSGDVGTLSVRILISVPLILVILFLIELCFSWVLTQKPPPQDDNILESDTPHAVSLLAPHLYHVLDKKRESPASRSHTAATIPATYSQPTGGLSRRTSRINPDQKPGEQVDTKVTAG
ncbi:unnamed protein product [Tuber aestivum]|uniref:Uncharacterized protein n=1 Tax=Tuber aestivum TaxID=59557 RepID=A0A292Q0D4_9PEZI|nr:unnamed protein product [Tuber aestivum]